MIGRCWLDRTAFGSGVANLLPRSAIVRTIQGGTDNVACGTVARSVSNCFATVWFNDIERVLNAWDVTIETTG